MAPSPRSTPNGSSRARGANMNCLGVDCGTSALKAVIVDGQERTLAASTQSYSRSTPHPLWREQDPDDWRAAMFDAFAALAREAPAAMGAVAAIGFSGQMHSAVLLGAADRPLRPAILHNDTRAFAEARELAERRPELAREVGVKPMAGFTAPKLMWLRRHEPEIFASVRSVLLPKDYLRLCLTGEKRTAMSDAAGTWWLDEARRRWSPAALAASGVDPALAPPLAEGSEAIGVLRDDLAARFSLPRAIVAARRGEAADGGQGHPGGAAVPELDPPRGGYQLHRASLAMPPLPPDTLTS